MKEMPSFIKWILRILIFLILVVIALKVTDNGHILNAFRSTYLIGRIGPDIDNHKFFTQRIIANGQKLPWKKATEYNSHSLTAEDSAYFKEFETVSYLVVQKGEILYEYYDEGYSDTSLVNSFSMAKSIVSMLVGIAIDEGKIKSVMDKASDYLTELKGTDKEEVMETLSVSCLKPTMEMICTIGPWPLLRITNPEQPGNTLVEIHSCFPLSWRRQLE